MATAIPNLTEIDFSGLTISDPKVLSNGGKLVYISNANRKPFVFKTPTLRVPYGMSTYQNEKYYLNMSLNDVDDFKDKLLSLQQIVVDEAYEKSLSWFKKSYKNKDSIQELFAPCVKYSEPRDGKSYPPTVQFSVPYKNDKFDCDAYDSEKNPIEISMENIPRGSKVSAIVQCSGVWIAGSKFGLTMKIVQMKVCPEKVFKIEGYSFIDDEDEEEADA